MRLFTGPTEPPPSYEEAQGIMTGSTQTYPPQTQHYQGPKIDGYSGNPPYPTQPGQPPPYPTQQGYPQQYYPYGQPATPFQGSYPPGAYVHPTVGYSPGHGVAVNQGPATMSGVGYQIMSPDAQRRKQIMIGVMIGVIVLIFFIIMFTVIF